MTFEDFMTLKWKIEYYEHTKSRGPPKNGKNSC
jgi:hypothetical protein